MSSTSLRSIPALALSLAIAASGCSISLDGPSTNGDRGRTRWQVQDGMCGGGLFGLDCALDVPIAEGAEPDVRLEPQNGATIAGATYRGEGALTVTSANFDVDDDGNESATLGIRAGSGTIGTIVVLDASGAELDRVSMRVARAVALECGRHASGDEDRWSFPDLRTSDAVEISLAAEPSDQRLACRAIDASGEPLLTVRAIAWTLESGAEVVTLDDDSFASLTVSGARIHAEPIAEGEASVLAQLGAVERRFTLTITP